MLQPESETFPFATFTDTEVLVGFQINHDTVVMYQYNLNNFALHMTKTIPGAAPILAPISPDATYRVEFQGLDLELYGREFSEVFFCKEMGNGYIQFLSQVHTMSTCGPINHIMTSSLVWPPSTQEARLDEDTLVIQAPASLITTDQLAGRQQGHWAWPCGGQTIGFLTYKKCGFDCDSLKIILVDTSGVDTPEDRGHRSEASAMAAIFSAPAPYSLSYMDYISSVDIDNARGRMVVPVGDGGLVFIEFV